MEPKYQVFVPGAVADELLDLWSGLSASDERRQQIPERFREITDLLRRDPVAGRAGLTPFLRVIERPPLRVAHEVSTKDRRILITGVELC